MSAPKGVALDRLQLAGSCPSQTVAVLSHSGRARAGVAIATGALQGRSCLTQTRLRDFETRQ
jgi:hypothetical protein